MPALLQKHASLLTLLVALLGLGLAFPVLHARLAPQQAADSPYLRNDPEKIVLSDRDDRVPCGECHTLEYDAWKQTPHSTGFDEMHRSPQAQSILERMDFRLAKRESLCLRCHYTAQIQNDQARAIAGVSCESCHGAARDWLSVHNDYAGATHDTETPEHARQRIQASIEGGMLRPSDNLYAVAANCFECHTVPSEELINVGRHPSGSRFELVDWSARIRHNFLAAQWSSDESNHAPSAERKRLMYLLGRLLDYEYSLRGAARATEEGSFSKAMERRVTTAFRELEKIAQLAPLPEVASVIRLHGNVRLVPNNEAALLGVAEQVRDIGQRTGTERDGSGLAALDPLIRGEGTAAEPDAAPGAPDADTPDGTAGANEDANAAPPPATPAAGQAGAAPSVAPGVSVSGPINRKPSWFPTETYQVTLPGCNCHATAEDWLLDDPHGASARPILSDSPRALEIAQLYGLSAAEMKQGNQICMQCHGTIESGLEAGPVFESVGCESCHGPSSGYLQPHKRGQGFQNGLKDLSVAATQAANCARCHHITDERLLSAGHSAGTGYDVAAGTASIKHWPDPDLDRPAGPEVDVTALQAAFDAIKQQRPVPQVQVARLTTPPAAPPPASGRVSNPPRQTAAQPAPTGPESVSTPPQPPRPRPVAAPPLPAGATAIEVPELPAVSDSTSTEDLLLLIKQRLETLYQALGRNE